MLCKTRFKEISLMRTTLVPYLLQHTRVEDHVNIQVLRQVSGTHASRQALSVGCLQIRFQYKVLLLCTTTLKKSHTPPYNMYNQLYQVVSWPCPAPELATRDPLFLSEAIACLSFLSIVRLDTFYHIVPWFPHALCHFLHLILFGARPYFSCTVLSSLVFPCTLHHTSYVVGMCPTIFTLTIAHPLYHPVHTALCHSLLSHRTIPSYALWFSTPCWNFLYASKIGMQSR